MNLEINQVIRNNDTGEKMKIVEVFTNTVVGMVLDQTDEATGIYSEKELIGMGYVFEYKKWKPQYRKNYYYIDPRGLASVSIWDSDQIDRDRANFMGVYPSEELANEAIQEIKEKLKD